MRIQRMTLVYGLDMSPGYVPAPWINVRRERQRTQQHEDAKRARDGSQQTGSNDDASRRSNTGRHAWWWSPDSAAHFGCTRMWHPAHFSVWLLTRENFVLHRPHTSDDHFSCAIQRCADLSESACTWGMG